MTVSSETSRISYTGAGTTGPFSAPFYFLENDDLVVIKTEIATGIETVLALTTDYTVAGAGNPAGGSVTTVAAVPATHRLTILRDPDLLQNTDYPTNDPFPAESHERALDKLTMAAQRLKDLIGRAVKLSDGLVGSVDLTMPSPNPGKAFKWNALGNGIENSVYNPDEMVALASAQAAAATTSQSAAATSAAAALASQGAAATSAAEAAASAASVNPANLVQVTGDQTIGGTKTFTGKIHLTGDPFPVGTQGSTGIFEVGDPSANTPATMSFHKAGFAINMGLDTDNVFRLGGWTQGLNTYRWVSDTAGNFTALGNITAGGQFIGNGSVPPGAVMHFAMNSPPTGWLHANGAAVSRATFAALFAAIGTTYGAGDGSTTFNLPDLRGEFIRGHDGGRNVDAGRVFGSAQTDAMQGHGHTNTSFRVGSAGGTGEFLGANDTPAGETRTGRITTPTSDGTNGTPRTASENRPRNIAMLACIKF